MNKKTKLILSRVIIVVLLVLLAFILNQNLYSPEEPDSTETTGRSDVIEVHFIDVGQGDAILVETTSGNLLIDAGENNKGKLVADYLKSQNVNELEYLIGTHPHSDHIGGLDTILNTLPVKKVLLPEVSHTTRTFEDVLDAIERKSLKITKPVVGEEYLLGPATFTIIAPNSAEYDEMNNYSIGLKLSFKDTSFLFTGDAEKLAEDEIAANGIDISADVIKLGHHGSAYSSSDSFLDEVDPTYAAITVGKDNEYDHPHGEALEAMQSRDIKVYRTDEQGTIVFTSDGKNISVNKENYKITANDLNHR